MSPLRVNRLHHPVTALGYGSRAGIWVQGCSIGCRGCASRDTWDADAGEPMEPAEIVEWLDSLGSVDGVSVSGGEPFQQAEALAELLGAIVEWRGNRPVDVLAFSGYAWPRLAAEPAFAPALDRCDAVVAGPYVDARNTGAPLRGSDNQRIVVLTALGTARYGAGVDLPPRRMQVASDGDRIRLIGIPQRGDLDRVVEGLAARGIALESVSWRS
jgi:anaerobic ribonucleoside-triphosphate reductase activating protein